MESNVRRAVPVKMIWMFVCVSLVFTALGMLSSASGSHFSLRTLEQAFNSAVPFLLLSLGAGLCACRGSLNLALPGIMGLSGLLFALINPEGQNAAVGFIAVLAIGGALGALVGVFAIQSRRSVALVTGLSSLLLGGMFSALTVLISEGATVPIRGRIEYAPFAWIGLVLALGLCFLGSLGLKKPAREISGGGRFVWTVVAGALAALAGALQAVRMSTAVPTLGSGYNEQTIVPVLLAAGILIPNARRSQGEAIFGLLSIVFAALAHAMTATSFAMLALDFNVQRFIHAILGTLFLIPNLLIYRSFRDDPPATASTSTQTPPEKEPSYWDKTRKIVPDPEPDYEATRRVEPKAEEDYEATRRI